MLTERERDLVGLTQKLVSVQGELSKAITDAKEQDKAMKTVIAVKDNQIATLQGQNDALSRRMNDLTNLIATLQKQITDAELKLGTAEGDREVLLSEVKRLQTVKADLERQFNDLKVLKAQVSVLKEHVAIANRVEFVRTAVGGMFSGKKGAEILMSRASPASSSSPTNFGLVVEIRTNSATVVPSTNTPPRQP
jgi:seryl-tRNA synthetase